jgi:TolA-binding protein
MDALPFLAIAGAAVGGALAGAAACYLPLSRAIRELRGRLAHSEQARAGAVERSATAREQIAQLNRAITELRRAHSTQTKASTSREDIETALAAGDQRTHELSRQGAAQPFADTEVMSHKL